MKKILKGEEETKYVAEYMLDSTSTGYVNFNSVINSSGDWYRCLPVLAQSNPQTNSFTRQGKEIKPIAHKCHWNFRFATTDDNSRDIHVVLYVLQSTQFKRYASTSINNALTTYSDYLDTGTGLDTYFDGTPIGYQLPVETDKYRVLHKKRIHLQSASGSANGAGVVGQYDGHGTGMYSPGTISATHSWTCPLPKKLKYEEGSTTFNLPTNASPVWAVGYYYSDGTPADTGGGVLAVDYWTGLQFKDD